LIPQPNPSFRFLHLIWSGLLIVSTLGWSWLAMQAVHELGHVLHAWMSGAGVQRIVLTPLEISRTDVAPNPHPQFVAWGGPVWGILLPAFFWWVARNKTPHGDWWFQFFAGFCLIANGTYLLGGCVSPVGDAEVLIQNGAPRVCLMLFGITTIPAGLILWDGQGGHFGFGRDSVPVERSVALSAAVAFVATVIVELLFQSLE